MIKAKGNKLKKVIKVMISNLFKQHSSQINKRYNKVMVINLLKEAFLNKNNRTLMTNKPLISKNLLNNLKMLMTSNSKKINKLSFHKV